MTKREESLTLSGIDKQELKCVLDYSKQKSIRCRNMDEGGQIIGLEKVDMGKRQSTSRSRGGVGTAELSMEFGGKDEYEEEDDESFEDDGEQDEDDSEVSFDEESDIDSKK